MTDIVIRAEGPFNVRELAEELRREDRSVDILPLKGEDYILPPEAIDIFIASTASAALLQEMAKDIYNSAKSLARKYFAKERGREPVQFRKQVPFGVYSSDNVHSYHSRDKLLFRFGIDSQGNFTIDYQEQELGLEVRASLADIPNAVVRVGGLLIVKQTDANGIPTVTTRELSTREIRTLEFNPDILEDPNRVLQLLAIAVAQLEEDERGVDGGSPDTSA